MTMERCGALIKRENWYCDNSIRYETRKPSCNAYDSFCPQYSIDYNVGMSDEYGNRGNSYRWPNDIAKHENSGINNDEEEVKRQRMEVVAEEDEEEEDEGEEEKENNALKEDEDGNEDNNKKAGDRNDDDDIHNIDAEATASKRYRTVYASSNPAATALPTVNGSSLSKRLQRHLSFYNNVIENTVACENIFCDASPEDARLTTICQSERYPCTGAGYGDGYYYDNFRLGMSVRNDDDCIGKTAADGGDECDDGDNDEDGSNNTGDGYIVIDGNDCGNGGGGGNVGGGGGGGGDGGDCDGNVGRGCYDRVSMQRMEQAGGVNFKPNRAPVVKRRNTANRKERRRTQSINHAFSELRECIPNVPADTKLSKIKTLRLATSYITYLMDVLNSEDPRAAFCGGFKADLSTYAAAAISTAPLPNETFHPNFRSSSSYFTANGDLTKFTRPSKFVAAQYTNKVLDSGSTSAVQYSLANDEEKRSKGRTGWPQHVWALELKPEI